MALYNARVVIFDTRPPIIQMEQTALIVVQMRVPKIVKHVAIMRCMKAKITVDTAESAKRGMHSTTSLIFAVLHAIYPIASRAVVIIPIVINAMMAMDGTIIHKVVFLAIIQIVQVVIAWDIATAA